MKLTQSHRPADLSIDLVDTTAGALLIDAATAAPSAVAVVEVGEDRARRECTYVELLDAATRTAASLLTQYEPGDRVAIWAPSTLNWEIFQFGAALAGLVVVTVNPSYRSTELAYVLRQSGCKGIALVEEFHGVKLKEVLAGVRASLPELHYEHDLGSWSPPGFAEPPQLPVVEPLSGALILYTSGTTGSPKGALLSHRSMVNNARLFARRFGLKRDSVWLDPLPMFHLTGCGFAAMGAMWTQSTHVLFPFEPGLALHLIESERANFMPAVPTMLLAMLEHPDFDSTDLSSLDVIMSGGTTVPQEVVRLVESRFGAQFGVVFGQTEVSGVICQSFPDDSDADKTERVGQPLEHTELKVVDGQENVLPCGQTGQIQVRGFGVMLRYFNAPEQTAEAITADGWLRTGDLGAMDDRGYVQVVGRLKDVIIRGGENIYPREIEDRLHEHPDVADVAVVGVPDERWGEQVAAFVRFTEKAEVASEELKTFLRADLSPFKIPRIWVRVDQLPTTPSGKVRKFLLRDKFEAGQYDTQLL